MHVCSSHWKAEAVRQRDIAESIKSTLPLFKLMSKSCSTGRQEGEIVEIVKRKIEEARRQIKKDRNASGLARPCR